MTYIFISIQYMAATHAIRVCDVTGFVKMAALEAAVSQLSDVDFLHLSF